VAQARVDGEDQRQTMKPGGRSDREGSEFFSKVDMYHVCSCGEDRGEDGRLGA